MDINTREEACAWVSEQLSRLNVGDEAFANTRRSAMVRLNEPITVAKIPDQVNVEICEISELRKVIDRLEELECAIENNDRTSVGDTGTNAYVDLDIPLNGRACKIRVEKAWPVTKYKVTVTLKVTSHNAEEAEITDRIENLDFDPVDGSWEVDDLDVAVEVD